MTTDGGHEAMQLRIAEDYVEQLGHLAKEANTLVIPANLTDIASMIALATNIVKNPATHPRNFDPVFPSGQARVETDQRPPRHS